MKNLLVALRRFWDAWSFTTAVDIGSFLLSQFSPLEPRNWMIVTISTRTNSTMEIALA